MNAGSKEGGAERGKGARSAALQPRGGAGMPTAQRPDLSCSEGTLAAARAAVWELLLSSE